MSNTKSNSGKTGLENLDTRELQRRLARAGYYHGAIDGIMGPQTRRALRAYEQDHGGGRPKGPKGGPKDGKGKNGGYRKGGKITLVLEEYCAKDLFVQLAAALGGPVSWKKKGKKKGKKGGPKGPKGGPKGPKGGTYGYKASRGSARTRRG